MLDLHSGHLQLCDSISRRRAIQAGALGTMGLGLPDLLASEGNQTGGATLGRAKRVILLFMWGGPAHQDTWDLKPEGPADNRGEFQPIETNVPGIHISEHFPLIAQHADKLAIIRSVGQEDNNHSTGAHAGLTGRRHELRAENFSASETDFPHFGSVLSKLNPNREGMPTFVALPDIIATTAGKVTPGQGAGIIGRKYDPFQIVDHPDEPDFSIASLRLPGGMSTGRMRGRQQLLGQIEDVARLAERSQSVQTMDDFYRQALDMVVSPKARRAFDIASIPDEERWRYGWHSFGQSVLMARRLVESGVRLVTVYWHREVKTIDSSWDTHALNFQELKNRLMPAVDRPIAALLEDLKASGMLDDTLVVWNSEFGRTPRINKNAGRDHWGPCNSVVMAGGGMPGGQVFGETDNQAAYPTANKVTQDDIAATIYHLLGYDPHNTLVHDRIGRPYPLALGEPIQKLLGSESKPQPSPPPRIDAGVEVGPFHSMLKERARRYIVCEFGNADSEKEWQLTGWTAAEGRGLKRHRRPGKKPATVKYLGHFYPHFNYGFLVFRLAEAATADGVQLSLAGRPIPIPDELAAGGAKSVWQIPFPPSMISGTKTMEITVEAPKWQIADMALVGDVIRDIHLARLDG
ncbi:MAG: DUF1501 domain-containing protein [Planctomycetaceae bacterium]|jgi:hypothetical protein|nr:DUF1501 domain-containing protein [Planctomycetaceae bacterium]